MRVLTLFAASLIALSIPASAQGAPLPADTVTVPVATPASAEDTALVAATPAPSVAAVGRADNGNECREVMLVSTVGGAVIGALAGAIIVALPAAVLSLQKVHVGARAVLWIGTGIGGAVMGFYGLVLGAMCPPG